MKEKRIVFTFIVSLLFIKKMQAQLVEEVPPTCGNLPEPSPWYTVSFEPFNTSGLPEPCSDWENKYACCVPWEAEEALRAVDDYLEENEFNSIYSNSSDSVGLENVAESPPECYSDFSGACSGLLYWHACAKACDYNYPRDRVTGKPIDNPCYARFSERNGRDILLWANYGEIACEHAKTLELGQCDAIQVIGSYSNTSFAIALGNGKAICMSAASIITNQLFVIIISYILVIFVT